MNNQNEQKLIICKVTQKGKKFIISIKSTLPSNDEITDYSFSEDQIIKYHLLKDQMFTNEEWDNINKQAVNDNYLSKAMNYISYKPRTILETKRYLKEFSLEQEVIDDIINSLIRLSFLDDVRYTKLFIDESARNLKGITYINYELSQKGIERTIISNLINNYSIQEVKEELVIKLQKIANSHNDIPIIKQKERIKQKLIRDGFDSSIINDVIEQIIFSNNSQENLVKDLNRFKSKTDNRNKIIQAMLLKGYNYHDFKDLI